MEKDEMFGGCGMHVGDKKMHTLFWLEDLKERDCSEELGINGILILQWISKNIIEGCGLDLPDSRYRLMSYCAECNLKFHKMQEILLAEKY
jgi:hypothetical protein